MLQGKSKDLGDCIGSAAALQSSICDNMNSVENGKMGDCWFWILDDIIAIGLISCALV